MKSAWLLAFAVIGCGDDRRANTPPSPDVDAASSEPDANLACIGPGMLEVSGEITASATWSGTVLITGNTSIGNGVTITVAAGTDVRVGADVVVLVNAGGTLAIQGTSTCHAIVRSSEPGTFWAGFDVVGTLTARYLGLTGGGIHVGGGKATVTDSTMHTVMGDLLTVYGGEVDMSYSSIGVAVYPDTTHCDMHFGGTNAANTIKVTHTNISSVGVAMMFFNGLNADFTYNNWFANNVDVDTQPAPPVSGDVSFGWFEKGAPVQPGITVTNVAPARISDAGPRP